MNRVSDSILKRTYLLFALMVIFCGLILAQILRIQVVQNERWLSERDAKRIYRKVLRADRGNILSDDNSILATSVPYYRVALDPTAIDTTRLITYRDTLDSLSRKLAIHFGKEMNLDKGYFYRTIYSAIKKNKKDKHVYLFPYHKLLDYNEVKLLQSFPIFNRGRYAGGLIVEKENTVRFHPMMELCRTTLGSLDRESSHGARGVEYSFNAALRGRDGEIYVQRVANNVEVPLRYANEIPARDGADVVTTINTTMQDIVNSTLQKAVKQHEAESGVAILMEVGTGHIKAISNYPETYNNAIATPIEPGSTFKIASAIAALEDRLVTPNDTLDVNGGSYQFSDRTMRDEHPYQKLTFQQVIEKSSNVGIAKTINNYYRSDPALFIQRLEEMGLLSYTDFQLKGEPQPFVIRPDQPLWNATTLPWLSTGYNIKLTPLQLLTFFNAIANNGTMIQPLIVNEIRSADGKKKEFESKVVREKICSDATLALIRRFLEGVVIRGTAKNINTLDFTIAGKTGTAKEVINGEYRNLYRSSFVGYFPADMPKYSCIVVINKPKSGQYYGAEVAAPVFRDIAQKVYSTLMKENYRNPIRYAEATPKYPVSRIMNLADAKTVYQKFNYQVPYEPTSQFVYGSQNGAMVRMSGYSVKQGRVPNVRGMSGKDAVALLENIGLRVVLKGHGKVENQGINPGSRYQKGEYITLVLG